MDRLIWIALLIAGFATLGTVIAGFVVVATKVAEWQCNYTYGDTGHKIRYKLFSGCQIEDNGGWIPVEHWRAM